MVEVKFNPDQKYALVCVSDSPYLFSKDKMSRDSFPDGIYVYEAADDFIDRGCFVEISEEADEDFVGTIFGRTPLDLFHEGRIYLPEHGTGEFEPEILGRMNWEEYEELDYQDELLLSFSDKEYTVTPGKDYVALIHTTYTLIPQRVQDQLRNNFKTLGLEIETIYSTENRITFKFHSDIVHRFGLIENIIRRNILLVESVEFFKD